MSAGRAFFQLLRLASPGLPIGAYCYSQGLESALDGGLVHDVASARRWLGDVLGGPLAHFDGALVASAWRALANGDAAHLGRINARLLASRETDEQRRETLQMGYSLRALLDALPEGQGVHWPAALAAGASFPLAWAIAAHRFGLDEAATVGAFLFGWLENQILVLMKAMPLGHTAGQQILSSLLGVLEDATATARALDEDEYSNFAPMLGLAAMRHETQYSRLFRS